MGPVTAARAGNREAALVTFILEVVRMPDEEFAVYRALPAWPARIAAAHTITWELRAEAGAVFDPAQAAAITLPILMPVGGDSPDVIKGDYATVAAALPDAAATVLDGQQHIAIDLISEAFAGHVVAFLCDTAKHTEPG